MPTICPFSLSEKDYAAVIPVLCQTCTHPPQQAGVDCVLRHSGDTEIFGEYYLAVHFRNSAGQIFAVIPLGMQQGRHAKAEQHNKNLC